MTQARRETITPAISIADLNTEIDSEPRMLDVVLGERLGFARPRKVREIIERNLEELEAYGSSAPRRGAYRGTSFVEYYLNEPQALLICMFSNTAKAAEVRRQLIEVFMEYRRSLSRIPVKAHERRASTKLDHALSLARSADRLERAAAHFTPKDRFLSAAIVNGQPVVFDINETDLREGDTALGIDWNGGLIVQTVSVRDYDQDLGHRPGGDRFTYGSPQKGDGCTKRSAFFAIGKVVEPEAVPQPRALALPDQYRGRRTKFRDEILHLLDTDMTNREIAQKTGACYQTVSHWRRWKADREVA